MYVLDVLYVLSARSVGPVRAFWILQTQGQPHMLQCKTNINVIQVRVLSPQTQVSTTR